MISNDFLPKNVHFNGLKLSSALEEFSITLQFFGLKNVKNQLFEENKRF